MKFSPKVYGSGIALAACVALLLITGNNEWLVGSLVSLATGGSGVLAPPAAGGDFAVSQEDVDKLAKQGTASASRKR